MNIFNKLNLLILEADSKSKKNETNDIPIHPEMETKEHAEKMIKTMREFLGI